MAPELGQMSIMLALALAVVQSIAPLVGAMRRDLVLMRLGDSLAVGQLSFVAFAFGALCYAFLISDFSVRVVAENSHTLQPALYKFAGTWGNHEGSMLLWAMILALFGAAVALFGKDLPTTLKARVLSVQGMIGAAFLAFIAFTSNPFDRLAPAPSEGAELNPLLQDPGLAFHPPFLYLGYVGFSMAFSFSVAALIEGRVDSAWARWVRPWALAAWCFLTIGIAMGSIWAYYELGWGGWWYWDPVENASFMPWLVGTALLHCALVVERRQTLVNWTILLGILTFSLSLIGTFLVRSGVLTSVHAFALDPARGVFILAILLGASMGALALYAWRAPALAAGPTFAPVSREGALVLNNIVLMAAAGTVFLGTFYPLLIDVIGDDKISVGPPYFQSTFAPLMLPLLLVMSVGPMLKWRKDQLPAAARKLRTPIILAGGALILASVALKSVLSAVGLALAVWLVAGALAILAQRIRAGAVAFGESARLALSLPGATLGIILGHASMGVCVAGIVAMSAWAKEDVQMLGPGEKLEISGYVFTLEDVSLAAGPNYEAERATFRVMRGGRPAAELVSERRYYPARGVETTEAGIRSNPFVNLYVALGEARDGRHVVRAYVHPLAAFIWIGALGMAAGGAISLTDRRFRLGARIRLDPAPSPARAA
ncbi:MAG: heme lyase CcmF/NrfE family subunit [Parvularculaceae bacterium]|nr:heme lyase CcmF/NrfE family subunit [Parvularculaceae bacterium]